MPTLETFAARFAHCVRLFRDPSAKGEQKTEFRALLGLLTEAVTLRVRGGRLEVNGVPREGDDLTGLIERLELHGIGEIAIPRDPPPAQLFELFRLLADAPGIEDPQARLGGVGAQRIQIVPAAPVAPPVAPPPPAAAPPATATETFGAGAPVLPSEQSGDRRSGALGTEGILRGESWRDIPSVPLQGVPLVTHDPAPPPAANALPGSPGAGAPPPPASPPPRAAPAAPPAAAESPGASDELSLSVEGTRGRTSGKRPSAGGASPPSTAAPPPVASAKPASGAGAPARAPTPGTISGAFPPEVAAALTALASQPEATNIDDVLAGLVRQVEAALTHNRMEQVLGIISAIVTAERKVSESSGVRRQYTIALKRVYTKRVLDGLTQLVAVPKHRPEAVAALQRAGADAVEVLVDRLVSAPTVAERRGVFDALRQMTEGTEQLIQMLDHREWFVVRNVAELLGELGMDDAIPALARKLAHEDERVRKAVGLALAKIGTRSAAEPLRRALRDKSADVRMQVALGIGGRKSVALAMPIVVALEEEEDETVERELILALGRIGSPDAVQALIKVAQPAGRIFGRKPSGLRLAAVEALRLAGTPPAVGTLEGLADDGDRQVRAAAREALEQLKRKPRP